MRASLLAILVVNLVAASCTSSDPECTSSLDCPSGRCVDGTCGHATDSSPIDARTDSPDIDTGTDATTDASSDASADTRPADTTVADTTTSDTAPMDTSTMDTSTTDAPTPECSPGEYEVCVPMGARYCRPSGVWSPCRTADLLCTGLGGSYTGCRGTGCSVCSDLLATFDCYFENHPSCVPNPTCASMYFTCSPSCPAPTPADRCP
jgi:hypothetical protein